MEDEVADWFYLRVMAVVGGGERLLTEQDL